MVALSTVDAMLCADPSEEESLDAHDNFSFGRLLPPLCPLPLLEGEEDGEDSARQSQDVQDIERCRRDLVGGMVHTR